MFYCWSLCCWRFFGTAVDADITVNENSVVIGNLGDDGLGPLNHLLRPAGGVELLRTCLGSSAGGMVALLHRTGRMTPNRSFARTESGKQPRSHARFLNKKQQFEQETTLFEQEARKRKETIS